MRAFTFIMLFFTAICARSQQSGVTEGSIEIIASPTLERLMLQKKEMFLADSVLPGFRIQVFSNSERKLVFQEEEKLRLNYPDIPVYMKYDSPNFKLRVGDFTGKLDAQHWFNKLMPEYPNLFLVPDKVNPAIP
jgi:hypothetical protein